MMAALIYLLLVIEQRQAERALERHKRKVTAAFCDAVEANMTEYRRQFQESTTPPALG